MEHIPAVYQGLPVWAIKRPHHATPLKLKQKLQTSLNRYIVKHNDANNYGENLPTQEYNQKTHI